MRGVWQSHGKVFNFRRDGVTGKKLQEAQRLRIDAQLRQWVRLVGRPAFLCNQKLDNQLRMLQRI
jgi:hypothetical protein